MIVTFLKGFTTGAGLIVAIGAQNAFVMRQGLLRRHLFLTALLCASIDALLIILGVLGFGKILSAYPLSIQLAKYFAIVFLFFYGILSLKSAFQIRALSAIQKQNLASVKATIFLLLGLSLLNPHVYLDTVILLGSIAAQQPTQLQFYFALGAITASFSWFFALSYGSQLLTPFLQKPAVWKFIDILIALTMCGIGLILLKSI